MSAPAYYNEWDAYAAQWLRNLISAGHLPAGEVDTRSIADVRPDDLAGFRQCHFFAGIGGWALAARLAGWPDDRELWTGSCPCQPFSVAGKCAGTDDERHLWPHQFRLLRACRPAVWMGEQVAAAVGKDWLDGVLSDLESIGYAGRAAVVPACAVDGPHRRDRLWLVADRDGAMGDGDSDRRTPRGITTSAAGHRNSARAAAWRDFRWVVCHDGKARRFQPGIQPLGDGFPARVGRLRAYGNAIVPQVAAEVIGAFMECRP